MSLASDLWTWLTEPLEERTDLLAPAEESYPDIDVQLYARQRAQAATVATPSIRQALGIPAIWRGITLLSTTAGSLNLKEYLKRADPADPDLEIEAAPVVRRPMRKWRPGEFTRDTVFYMGSRGEAIWIVRERDFQGFPSSVLPVVPESMQSDWDGEEHTNWRSQSSKGERKYRTEDVIHVTLMRDPVTGRGMGGLQVCGLAMNVATEADRWASRFFLGSIPSLYLDSQSPLGAGEPDKIKDQWLSDPPNVPKVGYGFDPKIISPDPESAQLTGSRMMSRGDAALVLGIPGRILEYAESGSSITYANVGDLATELVRLTLAPAYLEQIEQAFSDLRPRGHEVRYDVDELQRADVKTRFDVHEKAIASGIYDAEYAAAKEGISPDVARRIEREAPEPAAVTPVPLRNVG